MHILNTKGEAAQPTIRYHSPCEACLSASDRLTRHLVHTEQGFFFLQQLQLQAVSGGISTALLKHPQRSEERARHSFRL